MEIGHVSLYPVMSTCHSKVLVDPLHYTCYIQAQAIVVGFLASVAAMIFGWIPQGKFNLSHGLLLCASSVTTAAVASFVLGMSTRPAVPETHLVYLQYAISITHANEHHA